MIHDNCDCFEKEREAMGFHQHQHGWTNWLIEGDSLLVTNSRPGNEGMADKAPILGIVPPYGIECSFCLLPSQPTMPMVWHV